MSAPQQASWAETTNKLLPKIYTHTQTGIDFTTQQAETVLWYTKTGSPTSQTTCQAHVLNVAAGKEVTESDILFSPTRSAQSDTDSSQCSD